MILYLSYNFVSIYIKLNVFFSIFFSQKNSVEAVSLLVQDYHSRSAVKELNGKYMTVFLKPFMPLNISVHILHTALYTFTKVLIRRILTIKSFVSW